MLGALAIGSAGYLVIRPRLVAISPGLGWVEYPFLILVVSLAIIVALRAPRAQRATAITEWRKHAQVVRVLPDVELSRLEDALSAWLETGTESERAAQVLARITETPLDQTRGAVAKATSRRDRLKLLHSATTATRT